jgi:hypothetical protein
MERYQVSRTDSGLQIEGFPDGVRAIALEGPRAQRLADLALHKSDLQFAEDCLDAINSVPEEPGAIREALWRSAIVHFFKCFGDAGVRFQISAERVLKGEAPEAMVVFKYFKSLRNKHLVHDENSYSQGIPGAILNDGSKNYKVEKIVCFASAAVTLRPENFSNLKLLVQKAHAWVIAEFDRMCEVLTEELEAEPYDELLARASMVHRTPADEDLHKSRRAP